MKARSKPAKILELVLKGISVVLCIIPALFIQVIRVFIIAVAKGFPSLVDELTGEIDAWFKKAPEGTAAAAPEIDIVPILDAGIREILDKEKSVYIAHAIYPETDVAKDIEILIKRVKGQL